MILGIDPGATGALALLTDAGELLRAADMPVVEINGKRRVSAAELSRLIREWAPQRTIIEQVGAMPGQGVASMFAFGYSAGVLEGACVGLGVPVSFVRPDVWKRAMRVTKDKGACRLMAQRTWPAQSALFARVKDDGRAESALVGLYGLRDLHLVGTREAA